MKIAIVDDEKTFCHSLALEFRDDGFETDTFFDISSFLNSNASYDKIVLDLKIGEENSIFYVKEVRTKFPNAKIIILTGFGSIGTTVEAIKNGADDYLLKPMSFIELKDKLFGQDNKNESLELETMSLDRKEREYIEYILQSCEGNISKAAKKLGLHRQSLQRKLKKYTPN